MKKQIESDTIIKDELNYFIFVIKVILKEFPSYLWGSSLISPIIFLIQQDYISALISLGIATVTTTVALNTNKGKEVFKTITKHIKEAFNYIISKKEKSSQKAINLEQEITQPLIDADKFITDTKNDIAEILKVKYPGYEADIIELRDLALAFLEAKKQLELSSEPLVLYTSDWLNKQLEIERRIKERSRIHLNQRANMQMIEQIDQIIEQEAISSQTQTPTNHSDIELKL